MSVILGFVISWVVRLLARIPLVQHHPKLMAAILSAAVVVISAVCLKCASITDALKQLADQIGALALAAATATASAVATHEILIGPGLGPMNTGTRLKPGEAAPAPFGPHASGG